MFLIAVEGPVGGGKTTLLSGLVEWFRAQHLSADGFLAVAGDRAVGRRGAESYALRMVASDESMPLAVRDPSRTPPYRLLPEATAYLEVWAEGLKEQPPLHLLVLDEFGPMEAAGGGHMALWPALEEAVPAVVVVAVRTGLVGAIEKRLGRSFDLRVDATAPGAWNELRVACRAHRDWVRVGAHGAGAGGIEITLGSALHGARVPMAGTLLSAIQVAVMTLAGSGLGRRIRVVWVPFIAAGLKALSPAGSRLRPMLAISIQGLLFAGATAVAGWNALGVLVGGWLVGAWAASQGILLQYLLVGSELLRAYEAATGWLASHGFAGAPAIAGVIAGYIALSGTGGAVAAYLTWRQRRLPDRVQRMLEEGARGIRWSTSSPSWRGAARGGIGDLLRPVFWVPLGIIVAILLLAGSPWERAFWVIVRAATIGFLVFSAARTVDPRRIAAWLRARGHWGPALAFNRAVRSSSTDAADRDGGGD